MGYCDSMVEVADYSTHYVLGGVDNATAATDLAGIVSHLFGYFQEHKALSKARKARSVPHFVQAFKAISTMIDSPELTVNGRIRLASDLTLAMNQTSYLFEELSKKEILESLKFDSVKRDVAKWRHLLANDPRWNAFERIVTA